MDKFDKEFYKYLAQIDHFKLICLKDKIEYYKIVHKWLITKKQQQEVMDITPYINVIDNNIKNLKKEADDLFKIRDRHCIKAEIQPELIEMLPKFNNSCRTYLNYELEKLRNA